MSYFRKKLSLALSPYSDNKMQQAIHEFRRKSIQESRAPQSGAYYWIPLPDGDWTILPFYDSEYSDSSHSVIWKEVLSYIAHKWNKDPQVLKRNLGSYYTALPRGRISKTRDNGDIVYVLVHGNDSPTSSTDNITKIKRVFNLRQANVKVYPDDHETMIKGHPEKLQTILGKNLGLKGHFAYEPEDDYDDYDDYDDSWSADDDQLYKV